ncbi:molybdopterin-guanine dinucleotide biosynthesis protein MobA [Clostridium beijerinckii]|uniref:Probable molybdenum cofactor guanylyltransferase n=1 Tax=Clostridium beijerinckii TaxID=1520 RepID=A0A0B5QPM1_CLOBE|nr:molybdenum cofactor guanylyltransferase [Clostridium beijerinckii]AJH00207.1 molybdopterin-guanine dinucleotide biosynthesis protein MobA [Clostridium beijerinckii]
MDICALVLSGGRNTRMNGRNKAFLSYEHKAFIQNIIDVLSEFKNVYISVDNKEKYSNLNYKLIEDEYKEIGPIGGIYSSLKKIQEDYVFVTACDMPKLNKEFVEFLVNEITEDDMCVVVKDSKDRLYPLGGIYSKKIMPIVKMMIDNKDYKLGNLIKNVNGRIIPLSDMGFDREVLMNINSPDEYQRLKKH